MSDDKKPYYLGIDPGINGGLVALNGTKVVAIDRMPRTERDIWIWLYLASGESAGDIYAIIEQQTPRPTMFFDQRLKQWRGSILKSTCVLYGGYQQLRGFLIAGGIPFEECPPKRWQKALNIQPKEKGEKDLHWKKRLQAKAEQLFPSETVTLETSDALLLAHYCQRKREGLL